MSTKVLVSIHPPNPQNVNSDDVYGEDDDKINEAGQGEIEIDVEDYLKAARRPIEVSTKNKIICSAAFIVLIISICSYVGGLAHLHSLYKIMDDAHFKGPTDIIYVLMLSDVIAGCIGIWTCLKKTGPQPMIYSCVWLLLSSLVNLCVTISITFETRAFRDQKKARCNVRLGGSPTSEECTSYTTVQIVLWCSLLFFGLKIVVIVLCRINYPQVFNWMMGKDVYVDEELLPSENRTGIISNAGTLGGAYFDPPDLARIAARGSLAAKDGTYIKNISNSEAIFLTKEDKDGRPENPGAERVGPVGPRQSRRSTFFSL